MTPALFLLHRIETGSFARAPIASLIDVKSARSASLQLPGIDPVRNPGQTQEERYIVPRKCY
jgi:hypothetical protein